METLAIIAYRQPVTRGDIEDVRGVGGLDPDHPGARDARLDRRRRPPRNPRPAGALRHHHASSSTTSACARWRSCRRSRRSPRPSSSRWFPLPNPKPKPQSAKKNPSSSPPPAPTAERVQKLLAAAGLGSRREIETWIEAGRVSVNGKVAKLGDRATPAGCGPGGRESRFARPSAAQARVLLYHKPVGELVTRSDPQGRRNGVRSAAAGPLGCGRAGWTSTARACCCSPTPASLPTA